MLNSSIGNQYVGGLWVVAGGVIAYWFNRRREDARRKIYEPDGPAPTPDEASTIRGRLTADAFIGMGVWILLFVLLDWLF